jgi:hypothetical protein
MKPSPEGSAQSSHHDHQGQRHCWGGGVSVRKPLGDALGFPFEVGIAKAIKRTAPTLRAMPCRTATGMVLPVRYPQLPQQVSEWDTSTYCQAVNPLHTPHPMGCASLSTMRPVR